MFSFTTSMSPLWGLLLPSCLNSSILHILSAPSLPIDTSSHLVSVQPHIQLTISLFVLICHLSLICTPSLLVLLQTFFISFLIFHLITSSFEYFPKLHLIWGQRRRKLWMWCTETYHNSGDMWKKRFSVDLAVGKSGRFHFADVLLWEDWEDREEAVASHWTSEAGWETVGDGLRWWQMNNFV